MATPFYNSAGVFQDFFLVISIDYLDGVILSLTDSSTRELDFFAA